MNKKTICKILAVCLVCALNTTNVMAANHVIKTSKPSGTSFSTSWEKTAKIYAYDKEVGELCIGYETAYINEDYVWTSSTVYNHYSYIYNAIKERTSYMATTSNWAKLEVTHYSDFPTYGIIFKDTTAEDAASMTMSGFTNTNHK